MTSDVMSGVLRPLMRFHKFALDALGQALKRYPSLCWVLVFALACSEKETGTTYPPVIIDDSPFLIDAYPSWSSDGSQIIYFHYGVTDITDGQTTVDLDSIGLWLVDASGANSRPLKNSGLSKWVLEARFASRDNRVAIQAGGQIIVGSVSGDSLADTRYLTSDGLNDSPRWGPGDEDIIYESNVSGQFLIWRMSSDGSSKRLVPLQWNQRVFDPDWFPTGDRLLVAALDDTCRCANLVMFDTTGAFLRRMAVTTHTEKTPMISPDGAMITFWRDGWIWVVNADDTNCRPLARGYQPCWSPDGEYLAYISGEGAIGYKHTVWRVRLSDGVQEQLTHGP